MNSIERRVKEVATGKELLDPINILPGKSEIIDYVFKDAIVKVECCELLDSREVEGLITTRVLPQANHAPRITVYPHEYDPEGKPWDSNTQVPFSGEQFVIINQDLWDREIRLKLVQGEGVIQPYIEIDFEELTLDIERAARQTTPRQRNIHKEQQALAKA